MKIVYITMNFPYGAGEAFFIPEIKELINQGIEITIIPRSPKASIINKDAYQFESLCVSKPLIHGEFIFLSLIRIFQSPIVFLKLLAFCFKSRNLITFFKNISVIPKSYWLANYVKKNNIEHIHAQWALTTATLAMFSHQLTSIPWSFTGHRADILENNLLKLKIEHASFVSFSSSDAVKSVLSITKTPSEKIHKIYLGASIPKLKIKEKIDNNPVKILWPASFSEFKGHLVFLQSFNFIKDLNFELYLGGDGSLRNAIEQEIVRLAISDKVKLLGYIPHEKMSADFYNHVYDIVVLPSLHEGIPVSLIEAMSYEIPVIATEVGGIGELLVDNSGILIPPRDIKQFAEKLQYLIVDKETRRQFGKAGREKVMKDFNIEAGVRELINLFNQNRIQ
jgi:colanic acid/amylovoran biosynthesis glycosyltransferase